MFHNDLSALSMICIWILSFMLVACNPLTESTDLESGYLINENLISPFDGKAVVQMSEDAFYNDREYLSEVINLLVGNREVTSSNLIAAYRRNGAEPTSLSDLFRDASRAPSSHIIVTSDAAGDNMNEEAFILKLTPHYSILDGANKSLNEKNMYVALDPDVFYVQEMAGGKEIWPVTFPATSLYSGDEITITLEYQGNPPEGIELFYLTPEPVFDQNEYVENMHRKFAEMSPVIAERMRRAKEAGSTGKILTGGAGKAKSGASPSSITSGSFIEYISLREMKLSDTGDGSGASELQGGFEYSDNYADDFSKYPVFVFDNGNLSGAADGCGHDDIPDVNNKNQWYSFSNITNVDGLCVDFPRARPGLPFGPMDGQQARVVFWDDDKKYDQFSQKNAGYWQGSVLTFDLNFLGFSSLLTSINAESILWGSSDDPILDSGVRHLNAANANKIMPYKGYIYTTGNSSSTQFKITREDFYYPYI